MTQEKTKNYVLVHGAWGAGWEFDEVNALLSADGSTVYALDLPGHGENHREIGEVTMEAYVQYVIEAIKEIDDNVILVGHSLGGAVISQVAEDIPEKVDRLIYVAAMLPRNGDTALALMESDPAGQLLPNLIFSEDQSYVILSEKTIRELFLHDVEGEERVNKLVPEFLMKQAVQPFTEPARLTEERFGTVPKYYIRASLDKILSPELQDRLITHWNVEKIFTLNSGHFPLTSIGGKLADVIKEIG